MTHPTYVEQFQKEHPDALMCPNCGYKYYVNVYGVQEAYEIVNGEAFCIVCHGDPSFPHKSSDFKEKCE